MHIMHEIQHLISQNIPNKTSWKIPNKYNNLNIPTLSSSDLQQQNITFQQYLL